MLLTNELLNGVAPRANKEILNNIVNYQHLFDKYEVNTKRRQAYFLAQLAHESDGFKTTREYASGKAYEGRKDLGNVKPGDGQRYRGRGLIQLTGRANYKTYGDILGIDIESDPDLAERFPIALEIALAYWKKKGLNAHADKGDFKKVTKLINGGLNGYKDRQIWLAKFEANL